MGGWSPFSRSDWKSLGKNIKKGAEDLANGAADAFDTLLPPYKRAPPPSVKVVQDIIQNIKNRCDLTSTSDQSVLCTADIDGCSDVTLTCGNNLKTVLACNLTDMTATVEESLEKAGVDLDKVLPKTKGNDSVTNRLTQNIDKICSPTSTNAQYIEAHFTCRNSNNVTIEAINSVDQTTLCGITMAGQIADQAALGQVFDPDRPISPQPVKNPPNAFLILMIVIVVIIIIIAIVLGLVYGLKAKNKVLDEVRPG